MEDEHLLIYISEPITLERLQKARKMIDELTDKLIKEALNANSAINPSQE